MIWGAFRSLQTIWGTLWYHVRSLHTDTCTDTQAHIVLKILKGYQLDYIESWWVLAFTPEALSRPVVCRPWSSSTIANVITMIIVMMIYENRHEIQFTWCWASSEARSLSSVRAEQSGVATWDYLLTIGSINQCNCLKGLKLILLRSGTQWVTYLRIELVLPAVLF